MEMISDPIFKKIIKKTYSQSTTSVWPEGMRSSQNSKTEGALCISGSSICAEPRANDSTLDRVLFLPWALRNQKRGRRT